MKLATLEDGTRDGRLVVVSRDLTRAIDAAAVAPTLQRALDDWGGCRPRLAQLAAALERAAGFPFDPTRALAPLPRAYQWVDGSAYVNHVELVRKARGAQMPASFWTDPLVYQGGSDDLQGAHDDVRLVDEAQGLDFEAEVAVITDDVPIGTRAANAEAHIQLLVLVNDWSLRNLIPDELAKGFGFYQSKPATAFAPVAVTPDELGAAWRAAKVHLPLITALNGARFGAPNAGEDMTFDFARLIEHITKTRSAGAGTILGSGTVSNYDRSRGSSCIAERRALEMVEQGKAQTPFLRCGDRVRIEMLDADGRSIFGAIDQKVVKIPHPGPLPEPAEGGKT